MPNNDLLAQVLASGQTPGGGQAIMPPQMQTARGLPIGYGANRVPVSNSPPAGAMPSGPMAGGGKNAAPPAPVAPASPTPAPLDAYNAPNNARPATQWETDQANAEANPQQQSGNPWDAGPSLADYKRLFPYQAYGRATTWNDPDTFNKALERTGVDSYRLNWLGRNGEPIRGSGQTIIYRNGGWIDPGADQPQAPIDGHYFG